MDTKNILVSESAEYDNFLEKDVRLQDDYTMSLEKFFGEELAVPLPPKVLTREEKAGVYKVLYVHFRTLDDIETFCKKLNLMIDYTTNVVKFREHEACNVLFPEDPITVKIDKNLLAPKKKTSLDSKLEIETNEAVVDVNSKWKEHWIDMPEYEQSEDTPYRTVHFHFNNEKDYQDFADLIDQDLTTKTNSIWHPKRVITKNLSLRWLDREEAKPLRHPMYIVSKGRADTMITSRSLSRMKIPHYIIIEPQDEASYDAALDNFNIRDYVTLLVAPFSNHGDGPGRARNWAWDHSISIGATWHWVLDDNLVDFYRLHQNERIRFESSTGFRVMEDFCDRYENVYIAGPQYRFFIAPNQSYPPFVANTRIYSCLLIRNDCKHRWRGRYNEDTDICLRVMKDGDVCLQFNAFMQGKMATQTVAGGNTAEFYHAENTEAMNDKGYNTDGTINKSQMLADMHPDVARVVWRYGRWHHHVNYNPFKKNRLKLKKDLNLSKQTNDYGMYLDRNYDWKN
jgi:hypothetical protein